MDARISLTKKQLENEGYRLRADWIRETIHGISDAALQMRKCKQNCLTEDFKKIGDCPPSCCFRCVPSSCVLSGKFVLQVSGYVDITQPDTLRLNISGNNGMLKLFLTDGAHDVFAFEHSPIRALRQQLSAGMKICVQSPKTERGLMLLTSENTFVLGGSVSTMARAREVSQEYALLRSKRKLPDSEHARYRAKIRRALEGTLSDEDSANAEVPDDDLLALLEDEDVEGVGATDEPIQRRGLVQRPSDGRARTQAALQCGSSNAMISDRNSPRRAAGGELETDFGEDGVQPVQSLPSNSLSSTFSRVQQPATTSTPVVAPRFSAGFQQSRAAFNANQHQGFTASHGTGGNGSYAPGVGGHKSWGDLDADDGNVDWDVEMDFDENQEEMEREIAIEMEIEREREEQEKASRARDQAQERYHADICARNENGTLDEMPKRPRTQQHQHRTKHQSSLWGINKREGKVMEDPTRNISQIGSVPLGENMDTNGGDDSGSMPSSPPSPPPLSPPASPPVPPTSSSATAVRQLACEQLAKVPNSPTAADMEDTVAFVELSDDGTEDLTEPPSVPQHDLRGNSVSGTLRNSRSPPTAGGTTTTSHGTTRVGVSSGTHPRPVHEADDTDKYMNKRSSGGGTRSKSVTDDNDDFALALQGICDGMSQDASQSVFSVKELADAIRRRETFTHPVLVKGKLESDGKWVSRLCTISVFLNNNPEKPLVVYALPKFLSQFSIRSEESFMAAYNRVCKAQKEQVMCDAETKMLVGKTIKAALNFVKHNSHREFRKIRLVPTPEGEEAAGPLMLESVDD
eukprot:Rmarinus@m.6705